ncbi:MAG: capsular biosynthesis protein [Xanthomonadales bacterium]|nr:capsular biosynthesis protein [Xanthomonadales bacterium]
MIDLHSHLLPGIDDGAVDMATALEMARLAVADGITHSVLTPHLHGGRWDNRAGSVSAHLDAFRTALEEAGIDLQVSYSAEVRIGPEILEWVASDDITFLGQWEGQRVLLLELPHGQIPPGADKLTAWLLNEGIRPMIAHPERNKFVLRDLDAIQPFIEQGCLLQVTAGSVAGQFGEPARVRATELLQRGWVTILATDAHSVEWRPPNLADGRRAAEALVGESESWALVRERPWQIAETRFATR